MQMKVKTNTLKNVRKSRNLLYGGIVIAVLVVSSMFFYIMRIEKDNRSRFSGIKEDIALMQEDIKKNQDSMKELSSKTEEAILKYDLQIGELNQQLSDLSVESEGFSVVISDVINSVVSVITNLGQGSGAIISPEGHIVTNYHVIAGAKRAGVLTYKGDTYGVTLIGYNQKSDIAVLKIISNNTFDYFELGNSDMIKAGQKVVALGNPAGLSFTATEGIISSPSRLIEGSSYIQTDVTINPGNSGGPIINSKGELIGIINFKISNYEELGFAIPSNRVKKILDDILY